MTADDLPDVHPMMIRSFTPTGLRALLGGVLLMDSYDVVDVGMADQRLPFDTEIVDCSKRMFELTNLLIMSKHDKTALTVFPSRRWRNFRTGDQIEDVPDRNHPLLYLGNPVRVFKDGPTIRVERIPEFLIKSGMELGY